MAGEMYRLVESHPDAIRVEKRVVFVSASREKYQKTVELADVLDAEVDRT